MPQADPPETTYPIEVTGPDIERYRAGNTGIDYLTTLAADTPGPHVAVSAVVHGNEPCGAVALDWLFQHDVRPQRGKLSLVFVNTAAYDSFDPKAPAASRWVDEDLNRLWGDTPPAGQADTVERLRVARLRPWLETVDLLLDLHSMQHATEPLMLAGLLPRSVDLARQIGVPATIVCDAGHAAGRRMRDFGAFADPEATATGLLIECGQHWAASSAEVALEAVIRFLRVTGCVDPAFGAEAVPLDRPTAPQRVIDVTEAVTVTSPDFSFARPYVGMERIAKAGTVIADDAGKPVTTPYDDCILIMPSQRLWPGQTAVRLGRERMDAS